MNIKLEILIISIVNFLFFWYYYDRVSNVKRNIILACVLAVSLIVLAVSGSYAYFSNKIENTGNGGVSVTGGDLEIGFTDDTDETHKTITVENAGLTKDDDVTKSENYTKFGIELKETSAVKHVKYQIYLTDISMTCNFKSADLKWALYRDKDSNLSEQDKVASGDFSNLTTNDNMCLTNTIDGSTHIFSNLTLTTTEETLNLGETGNAVNNYRLYIWLSYSSDKNQTDLLNGSLSAKVGFRAVQATN